MDINLEYYKIFYYVASYKSITLAAEMLSISFGEQSLLHIVRAHF